MEDLHEINLLILKLHNARLKSPEKTISYREKMNSLFGWLEKSQKLWKNCIQKVYISTQIVTLAFISIFL